MEGGETNIPELIVEGKLAEIAPKAYTTANDLVVVLSGLYRSGHPDRDLTTQAAAKDTQVRNEVVEALYPAEGDDSDEKWQEQWMAVFKAAYDLQRSRLRGEGEGRGSEEKRFVMRALQGHLVMDERARIEEASEPVALQFKNLLGTMNFAFALAELHHQEGVEESGQALLNVMEDAILRKEEVIGRVAKEKPRFDEQRKNI